MSFATPFPDDDEGPHGLGGNPFGEPHVDAPLDKLRRLRELQAEVKRLQAQADQDAFAQKRHDLLAECPHPLALAAKFDQSIVQTPAMELVSQRWVDTLRTRDGRLTISVPPQQGKAAYTGTMVLTTAGHKTMGDLVVGDEVFHPDGHPTKVVAVHPVRHDRLCYRVTTVDGRSVVVDAEHLWTVQDRRVEVSQGPRGARVRTKPWVTLTTQELIDRGVHKDPYTRPNGVVVYPAAYRLPDQRCVISKPVELPLEPYLLGQWLGDGTCGTSEITVGSRDVAEVRQLVESAGGQLVSTRASGKAWRLTIAAPGGFRKHLTNLGVLRDKHIPEQYLTAGTEQRLALLQGLLDTDGSIFKVRSSARVEFTSVYERFARQVLYLVRSLGWRATLHDSDATLDGKVVGRRWRVCFTPDTSQPNPFRLHRKAAKVQTPQGRAGEAAALSIASIEPVESVPVRCITVESPDGLFLLGDDLVPTHNSLTARWAIFWALLDDPRRRVVFASYGQALARTSGRIVRSLVEQFGGPYGLILDESHRDAADWQLQEHGGGCLAAGVGSSLTGRPSDLMVLDDLLAGQAEANSELVKTNVSEWWDSVARTRMAPGTPAVAIGTRWAEDDILARFIEEGWTRLNIPATSVAGDETLDSLDEVHAGRTVNGYLISTRGTTEEDWEIIRKESGARTWEALFRGNPTPPEGGIFLKAWFNDHRVAEAPKLREIVIGVDPAETGLEDEAGILVVGRGIDNDLYVLDDLSGMLTQAQWARRACLAWIEHEANRVIQERTLGSQTSIPQAWSLLRRQAAALESFGSVQAASDALIERGDSAAASVRDLHDISPLVESIRAAGGHGPRVVTLTPKQSKTVRAETATQPFETGRAHMVGDRDKFYKLEHEATHWQPGMPSPNRLDVLSLVINHFGNRGGIIV